ncbi:hypothetical protein [Burkholderia pseudomallei]|uniref:Uncharacterized protein n=2 Tax=Burkholderia pseudomallei TaxID=28450 RepID=A0AAX0U8R9_BURPE|nr:hypothetical protein [Burkholderia pseudomallei]ABN95317.1 hypothetical protein BURPS1106A_A2271 [Burkholderia pseudomallei 1106a]AFR20173.1 hypothetical protein BPC006_II2247 [Burkholderia pseudomallei BPC006]AUL58541.1 hypothetical protein BHT10_21510 [Burkholderia pseudomallei]EDO88029.1 hypothetical protein BURPS406E_D0710 [Burkholderia pseudomallei 406e]EDO89618.1 hypothetical protein BURPSPAST_AC0643 [Burkholderia pseudomallei Pasteur 52237]
MAMSSKANGRAQPIPPAPAPAPAVRRPAAAARPFDLRNPGGDPASRFDAPRGARLARCRRAALSITLAFRLAKPNQAISISISTPA